MTAAALDAAVVGTATLGTDLAGAGATSVGVADACTDGAAGVATCSGDEQAIHAPQLTANHKRFTRRRMPRVARFSQANERPTRPSWP